MVKAIIFDFWGTLCEQGTPSLLKQAYYTLRVDMPYSDFVVKFEEALMTRRFEDKAEAFKQVFLAFNQEPKSFLIDKLIGIWNKGIFSAQPYPETVSVLTELKEKYKLALISNSDCFSLEPVLDKFDLRKYFDSIVLSYDVGLLKTNPKMFNLILKQLSSTKKQALMVGDSIETDIKGAESAGIKPVLIDRRDTRDYPNKIRGLKELNKFL